MISYHIHMYVLIFMAAMFWSSWSRQSSPSIKNVEVDLADAVFNLNEKLLLKKKSLASAASTGEVIESSSGYTTSEKPPKQPMNVLVATHASKFPEKVSDFFSMR